MADQTKTTRKYKKWAGAEKNPSGKTKVKAKAKSKAKTKKYERPKWMRDAAKKLDKLRKDRHG